MNERVFEQTVAEGFGDWGIGRGLERNPYAPQMADFHAAWREGWLRANALGKRAGTTSASLERADHERAMDAAQGVQWLLDAAELLSEPDPGPTPWLVSDLIVDGALIAVVGRWKTAKSYGVLELCIAVATGRPAFGAFAVPAPGRVIFVNEESGKAALWRRLDALCRGRATDPESLRDCLYVAPNARVKLDDPGWQEQLLEYGRELEPRLIVFDPLARMKAPSRKENVQEEMAPLIEFMRELRDATGAGVLFVHHTGHQGEHMRGASDLESAWETEAPLEARRPGVRGEDRKRAPRGRGNACDRIPDRLGRGHSLDASRIRRG
jgi:hypothetical protein